MNNRAFIINRNKEQYILFLQDMDTLFREISNTYGYRMEDFFAVVEGKLQYLCTKWDRSVVWSGTISEVKISIKNAHDLNKIFNHMLNSISSPLRQIVNYFLGKRDYPLFAREFSVWRMVIEGLDDQALALTSPHPEVREFALIWNECLLYRYKYDQFIDEHSFIPIVTILVK